MSQILIIIVIVYGSILNLLAKPWSSTESMLERRRNDMIAILLWVVLGVIAIETVRSGIANSGGPDAFDLQDWTALVLPFALAAPYLLELAATLVRQIEMWRWMRRSTIQALPLAWLYRTMTVGEPDDDGHWMRSRAWAPWEENGKDRSIISKDSSFWNCTSRQASLFHIFLRWMSVLMSALRYTQQRAVGAFQKYNYVKFARYSLGLIFIASVTTTTSVLLALSCIEILLLLIFDYFWWRHCKSKGVIVARYDTVHFGRQEMQSIFEHSIEIKSALDIHDKLDINVVHNRIMGAVITTTAVLENAFRRAYLATPVYEFSISNRKALRDKYAYVGCHLDRLIKQVRILLEMRHTSGLLSITSSTGTIEASLHNNIESILSIALYLDSGVLYNFASRIAKIEHQIEDRIKATPEIAPENVTRERVVYIDARNAMFWLLWILVAREWKNPADLWSCSPTDKMSKEAAVRTLEEFPDEKTEILYVIATFLSRCRYCDRYGLGTEQGFYIEARELGRIHGERTIDDEFLSLSRVLEENRGLTLLGWTEREYKMSWTATDPKQGLLECSWMDDSGARNQAKCDIALSYSTSEVDFVVAGHAATIPHDGEVGGNYSNLSSFDSEHGDFTV